MPGFVRDFRFALRILRRNLSVTVLAVASLALAIAGNTTVYSLVNSFLHRPLPYAEVERLAVVGERQVGDGGGGASSTSPANFLDFRERQRSFDRLAAVRRTSFTVASDGRTERLAAGEVTPDFLPTLGVAPDRGRPFRADEATRGRENVAIVADALWQERFAGRELAGATLDLDGRRYDVVGVLAPDFEWIFAPDVEVWVPLVLVAGAEPRQQRDLMALGHLAPGVSEQAAEEDLGRVMAQLVEEHPDANRGSTSELTYLGSDVPEPQIRMFLQLMQVALLFVLLIACANVANLLLSRSQARGREIAIRSSIGAGRRRIVAQLFTESLIMAAVAGAAGILLGFAGMKVVANATAGLVPRLWVPTLEPRVLLYSLAMTAAAGVLVGLAPALRTSRVDLVSALKDGARGASVGRRQRLTSNGLVVAEIGLALAFLAGASMMIQTFQSMQGNDPGFDTAPLLTLRAELPASRYGSDEAIAAAVEEITARIAALPGARAVAVSDLPPRTSLAPQATLEIAGQAPAGEGSAPQATRLLVGAGYFEALGVPVLRGRAFAAGDRSGSPAVAMVNEALAARHWAGESALERRLTVLGEERTVVGVVATVDHAIMPQREAAPVVYLPWAQQPATGVRFVVAADGSPAALAEPVRRELAAFDPGIGVSGIETVDDLIARFFAGQRVFTVLLGAFGLLALLLAAIGTYGVLSYAVAQRTHEIGVRMAMGAGRATVVGMITRQGLVLGLIGIALSVPLIFAQVKVISSIFAGTVPVEVMSVFAVATLLAVVTVAASALPARRAASIDPIRALHGE
jgi:putative ABC transport system permease protein